MVTEREPWPSALEAAEYELYVYRMWADSPVNDVTEGGLVERVRLYLAAQGLEPHVVTSDLREFDRMAANSQEGRDA